MTTFWKSNFNLSGMFAKLLDWRLLLQRSNLMKLIQIVENIALLHGCIAMFFDKFQFTTTKELFSLSVITSTGCPKNVL